MQIIKASTHIDFMHRRRFAYAFSGVLMLIAVLAIAMRGLNFGIDFTGGTVVEIGYDQPVDIGAVRSTLQQSGFDGAVVQYFGTGSDILVRLPAIAGESSSKVSDAVMATLHKPFGEMVTESPEGGLQRCISNGKIANCEVQMRRVEFVGPQVGAELAEKGGLAMLIALILIMIYVMARFVWRCSVGAVAALVHDVLITVGVFALFQFEFSLSVLAAVLAVIGYSLNDTIVVLDRIRETLRKKRRDTVADSINQAVNETLSRTLLTSFTTLLVVGALLVFGGEVIRGFSIALFVGIGIGTYSSIFVASPLALELGMTRNDFLIVKKEGAGLDETP